VTRENGFWEKLPDVCWGGGGAGGESTRLGKKKTHEIKITACSQGSSILNWFYIGEKVTVQKICFQREEEENC